MRRIKVSLSIGYLATTQKDVIEVEDAATEDEIDETVQDWVQNYISVSWSED